MSVYPDHVDYQQRRAACNSGIGSVERPEVPAKPVHIDEIDNMASRNSIDQVSDGATRDEREADLSHR